MILNIALSCIVLTTFSARYGVFPASFINSKSTYSLWMLSTGIFGSFTAEKC